MIRTVVYKTGETPRQDDAGKKKKPRRRQNQKDTYLERLVKYVPAEVTAVFAILATGAASVGEWLVVVVVVAGIVTTPIYLWERARALPAMKRPNRYFYLLATVAFGFWALGVSDATRDLINLDAQAAEVLLGLAALVIPAIDVLFSRLGGD